MHVFKGETKKNLAKKFWELNGPLIVLEFESKVMVLLDWIFQQGSSSSLNLVGCNRLFSIDESESVVLPHRARMVPLLVQFNQSSRRRRSFSRVLMSHSKVWLELVPSTKSPESSRVSMPDAVYMYDAMRCETFAGCQKLDMPRCVLC